MDFYAFGFERSVAHPLGLWAHEVTRFSLGELRRLFGAACHDARERRANGDRDIPVRRHGLPCAPFGKVSSALAVLRANEYAG